ncbi:UDP:flavonoid glycosyltransferase YjiC, YdhE family [Saccharicrinis carchari]|uniref:UDP:flavonoid glycosyltransferase YjiC, YdhE family n=1 Tax=Saccharicrinis carchari TaxID=1168039 RepID=A0A521ESM6_SACCC|nr:UDP:flavonoid glycosyltransferase YjiC, YdhE family [Saccharicrinis carchari]
MVCPLNWGLGHASRMIPVVNDLLKQGNKVILGGDGDALRLMSNEFPDLQTVSIPDVEVRLGHKTICWSLLGLVPKMIYSSFREHCILKRLIKCTAIDVVIADNRYGLWNKKIKSIFVTHQLMLKLPKALKILEYPVHLLIKMAVARFDTCWVPDYADRQNSLSGDLSHKYALPRNTTFIGPLSRFAQAKQVSTDRSFKVVAVLSGPEPLRSELEEELRAVLSHSHASALIVQGKPSERKQYTTVGNITSVPHLDTLELRAILKKAHTVICRSGYSSIMDLEYFKSKAILIPTPGQTEQEYLALHLTHKHLTINQTDVKVQLINYL